MNNIKLTKHFEGIALDMAKAIRSQDVSRIQSLSNQLDLNQIYSEDITFLLLSMAENKKMSASALLDSGADPSLVSDNMTPAYLVSQAEPEWLKLFLNHGMNPNAVSAAGAPIIMGAAKASEENSLENIKLLMKYHVNINAVQPYTKKSALHEALMSRNFDTAMYLMEQGIDLSLISSHRKSAADVLNYLLPKYIKEHQYYEKIQKIKKMMEVRGYTFGNN